MNDLSLEKPKTPILIVGAGPAGLTMALELHRHNVPFRIIDAHTKPVPTSNALAAQARTLEVWDDEGIIDQALAHGYKVLDVNVYAQHKKIVQLNTSVIPSAHPYILAIPQHHTEAMLLTALKERGILVEMNTELVEFSEGKIISVTLRHENGTIEHLRTNWLIACDGSHSFIRTQCQVDFNGKELPQHFVLADVKLTAPSPQHAVHAFLSEQGPFVLIPFAQDYVRIIAEVSHAPEFKNAKTVSYEQLKKLAAERCSFPLSMESPIWTSAFWIHERIISSMRKDNIFFIGDAAHIHSPVGALGMNTGIQDAYNLAWKLALFMQNKARASILDTYTIERYPVAKAVLRNTTFFTRMVTLHTNLLCHLRNFIISHLLKSKKISKKFLSTMTQLAIRYQAGPLVKDCLGNAPGPKAGTRMPYHPHDNLLKHARSPEHTLLFFAGKDFGLGRHLKLKNTLKRKHPGLCQFILIHEHHNYGLWDELKILDHQGGLFELYSVKSACLYLIRPDKIIGFRGTIDHEASLLDYLAIYH